MILFVAPDTELNIVRLKECCEWSNIEHFHLDTLNLQNYQWVARQEGGMWQELSVVDRRGVALHWQDVSGIWCREANFASRFTPPSERNLVFHECKYLLDLYLAQFDFRLWMNQPSLVRTLNNRLLQMTWAKSLGFAIPETIVTNKPGEARAFLGRCGEVIVKRISAGGEREDGDRILFASKLSIADADLLDHVTYCPTLLQKCIDKAVEFRLTVVDDEIFVAAFDPKSDGHTEVDSRLWQLTDSRFYRATLPSGVGERAKELTKRVGLRYAAIDLILDEHGDVYFLEFNCSGQWGFVEHSTGLPISERIISSLART